MTVISQVGWGGGHGGDVVGWRGWDGIEGSGWRAGLDWVGLVLRCAVHIVHWPQDEIVSNAKTVTKGLEALRQEHQAILGGIRGALGQVRWARWAWWARWARWERWERWAWWARWARWDWGSV